MKFRNRHILDSGTTCPFCNSTDIRGGPSEIEDGKALRKAKCLDCGGVWRDRYALIETEPTWEPDKIENSNAPIDRSMERLLILDVDATDLFADESDDWKYCVEQAPFSHRDACEFMIYIGMEENETFDDRLREMHMHNEVSEDLLELMRIARQQQAVWLLLHA